MSAWLHPRRIARHVRVQRSIQTGEIAVEPRRRDRARNAVRSLSSSPDVSGPIWAVAMVRDEADMVAESVMHLLDEGVDHVLIADNGSRDGTRDILSDLSRSGPVHVLDDPSIEFWQAEKVSLLSRAATRHGAAWIIPFDADELWFALDPTQTLGDALRAARTNVVTASWWQYVPLDRGGSTTGRRFPFRLPNPDHLGKVAFRANWLARVTSGGHAVTLPSPTSDAGLRIAHFRYRSLDQVVHKARIGSQGRASAGRPIQDYWEAVATGGEAEARRRIDALVNRQDLVHDPVTSWRDTASDPSGHRP